MFTDKGAFKAKGKSEEVRLFEPAEPAEVSRA
jgi:hypothetical protein